MADPVPAKKVPPGKKEPPPVLPSEPDTPVSLRVKRAIAAHPVLKSEKKLQVRVVSGRTRVEGTVFTRDMHKQLVDLVTSLPGSEDVTVLAQPEIAPPQPRVLEGKIPPVSPGAGSASPDYSVSHLKKKPR
jgi:hypothetical protein